MGGYRRRYRCEGSPVPATPTYTMESVPRTDEVDLCRRLAAGDRDARAALYERHLDDVLGWCVRLGSGRVDPEEAAHDVFVVALTKVGSFRGDSALRTWLFGVTRRVLANQRRRARTRRLWETLTGRIDVHPEGGDPLAGTLRSERQRLVIRCLESLSLKHREVVVLNLLEGRPAHEVAEILGVPEGTVYSRLHHARRSFRRAAGQIGLMDDDACGRTRGRRQGGGG